MPSCLATLHCSAQFRYATGAICWMSLDSAWIRRTRNPKDVNFQTPEITKPLVSLETRGFVYIECGGEGEIRNYPFAVFETEAPGL